MSFRLTRKGCLTFMSAAVCVAFAGCGSRSTLPSTVLVELPDGTSVEVDQDSGVASLANTTWRFLRVAGEAQGMAFMTISFGSNGNLEGFEENTIAPEIFGSTILFDGQRHATGIPGVEYSAATFGAQTSDGSGFAFEGRITAFAGPIPGGNATATATGTFDPNDPDTMSGTFAFTSSVTLISIPEANMDEEFFFVAHRVTD